MHRKHGPEKAQKHRPEKHRLNAHLTPFFALGTGQDTQDTTEDTDSPSQLDGSRKARKITRDLEEPPD
jgi:hypothetical protein